LAARAFAQANAARLASDRGPIKFRAASLAPGLWHDACQRIAGDVAGLMLHDLMEISCERIDARCTLFKIERCMGWLSQSQIAE